MPIEFDCVHCSQKLRVPDDSEGKRACCPTCNTIADIPKGGEAQSAILLDDPDRVADVIDYEIFGKEMQYVEITLDPGEMAIADPDVMMYMTSGIEMATLENLERNSTLLEKIVAAGLKMFRGDSLQMASYYNVGDKRAVVAFAAATPGKLIPMHLDHLGGELICQREALLCAARGIEISPDSQRRSPGDAFGRDGYTLHMLRGDGIVVVQVGGVPIYRRLEVGETIRVDAGCLAAFVSTVKHKLEVIRGVRNVFGTEGILIASLTGPGDIWLQSLPASRINGRVSSNSRGAAPEVNNDTLGISQHAAD